MIMHSLNKRNGKPYGQSRIENPDTQATSETRHRNKKLNTAKTKLMSTTDPTKNPELNTGAYEGLAVSVSDKIPGVLLSHVR